MQLGKGRGICVVTVCPTGTLAHGPKGWDGIIC